MRRSNALRRELTDLVRRDVRMSESTESMQRRNENDSSGPSELVGITVRSFVLVVLLTVLTYLVINRLGFMQLVPPVPALMLLLLLVGCNKIVEGVTRALPRGRFLRPLSRGELLLIYVAISMAPVMSRGVYVFHYLLYPAYYGNDVNQWQEFFQHYPDFYAPRDPGVIKGFFEGSSSGLIPWEAWRTPLLWWMTFNMLVMVAVGCLVAFFRRQWAEAERLRYPLLVLPLEITGGFEGSAVERGFFFRDPLMWLGFTIAVVYNCFRIAHEIYPAFPEVQHYIRLAMGIADPPWRWIRPLNMHFRLDVWGLSYLMPGDVLLTAWVTYFGMKTIKIVGLQSGYRKWRFPFYQEVSSGACIALTLSMLYVARRHFRRIARSILRGPGAYDENEPMSYRLLVVLFVASTAAMIWMLLHAGHRIDLLLIYFAVLYMFVLVAARIRAEAGPPVTWTHPYGYDTEVAIHLLGSRYIRGYGSIQPMVLYYALFYIGRTVFAHSGSQYFADGYRLVDYGRAKRAAALKLMMVVLVISGFLAFWTHLDLGYTYGQAFYFAGEGREHRTWPLNWSRQYYRFLDLALDNPQGPDRARVTGYAAGFAATAAITWGRLNLSAFPLHPLGVVLGTLYNDWSPYWAPFLFAWLAQRLALRYGGLPAYRRFVPAWLGMFLGHTLIGNVLRGIIIRLKTGL